MKWLLFIVMICSCFVLSSCEKRDIPSLEEYKKDNRFTYEMLNKESEVYKDLVSKEDKRLEEEWELEYGDMMFHADGTLRDQDLTDNYTAGEHYILVIAAIWLVFFVWAGIMTRHLIGFVIVMAIGVVLGAVAFGICFGY